MNFSIRQTSEPPYEPVSLAQAKNWLGVDDDDVAHDDAIRLLIKAAREFAENLTLRAYVPRTYRLTMDDWPEDCEYGTKIVLPYAPLLSVESIAYIDQNGDQQTLAADQYAVHTDYEPGFVIPAWNVVLPVIRRVPNALQVNYTAGYDPGSPQDQQGYSDALPAALQLWLKTKLATLFENREQLISGTIVNEIPRTHVDGLLDSLVLGDRLF